ncbi:MAG: UDP-N-acetylmuramoyl-L-alanine--D-glutamate ligase [Alphaproteobacteria bacterium]
MYNNKKVLVLGLSKSGISAAKYLNKLGAKVFISEFREEKEEDAQTIKELQNLGIKIEMGGHSKDFIDGSSLAITSPGIPPKSEVFQILKAKGIQIISEVELAYLNTKTPFVVITGTNGKTTTTALANHIISSELKSEACGNIGCPPCYLLEKDLDCLVCELSSYQLEMSPTLTPNVAIFTNITPDHLSWHGGFDNYFNAKAKIFTGKQSAKYCAFNAHDEKLVELSKSCPNIVFFFGKNIGDNACYIEDDFIVYKQNGVSEKIIEVSKSPIVGYHNYLNIMASVICAKVMGVSNSAIMESIISFKSPEHRLEKVAIIDGVEFYNDSKATNPEASIVAMNSFAGKKVALIAGGTDKLTPLDEFCDVANKTIDTVVLIGQGADRFEAELKKHGFSKIKRAKSLQEATDMSFASGVDIVLLSPACASFDMFNSYEHRGDVFKEYVKTLNKALNKNFNKFL